MDKINFTSSDRNVIWALFLASCITYILNIDFTSNGDTIYYANIIDTLNFDKLTTHQAYYLLGFLFTKDLNRFRHLPSEKFKLKSVVRSPVFVPKSKKIKELLQEFKKMKRHMAIVLNEYGSVDFCRLDTGVAGCLSRENASH